LSQKRRRDVTTKTSQFDPTVSSQPLVELEEHDLYGVAGGQYSAATYIASDIRFFGLALGTGGTATATGNSVTATAGADGVAVVAAFVGSLNAIY
jgi:hypothetical protein